MTEQSDIIWIGHGRTAKGRCRKCGLVFETHSMFWEKQGDVWKHDCAGDRNANRKERDNEHTLHRD